MKFGRGNQSAAKPKWTKAAIIAFQRDLVSFRRSLNYEHADLSQALDYSVKYTRQMQGDWGFRRQPSEEFVRRLNELKTRAKPKPKYIGALVFDPDVDAIPLTQVLARIIQCPECVWECKRGLRDESRTWWVARTPQQKYHSPQHRHAAAVRRAQRRHRKTKGLAELSQRRREKLKRSRRTRKTRR